MKIFSSVHEANGGSSVNQYFEKKGETGRFWLLTLLPFSENDANKVVHHISSLLEEKLVSDQNVDSESLFESALKEINETLPKIMGERAEEVLRTGALLIGYLDDDELLVSSFGQGEVFLLRNQSLMEISEGISPSNIHSDYFQNISSGDVQDGDKLVLSTFRLQRYITEKQLSSILEEGVTEAMEGITSAIDSQESGNIILLNVKSADAPTFPINEKPVRQIASLESVKNSSFTIFRRFTGMIKKKIPQAGREKMLVGGAIAIAMFLLFLFFLLLTGKERGQENLEFTEFVNTVEQQFSTVETRFIEGKPDQSNLILDRIEKMASEMLVKRIDVSKADQILTIAQKKREYVNRIMRITNPEVMVDLGAVNSEIQSQGFFFLKNEILTYDKNSMYRSLISGAKSEGLGIITDDDIKLSTPFPSKNEALFITENGSVLEWKNGQTVTADTADETWKPAKDIRTFSKFLYVLDAKSGQIWKYERRDSGFTIPEGWVTTGKEFLKNTISFAIDGSIYALTNAGDILKFHRGEKVDFALKNAPTEGISGDKIFTNQDLDSIFILDKKRSRILIFGKSDTEAVYKKQIILENIGEIIDFLATENKIYVLGKERIYEIPLNTTE